MPVACCLLPVAPRNTRLDLVHLATLEAQRMAAKMEENRRCAAKLVHLLPVAPRNTRPPRSRRRVLRGATPTAPFLVFQKSGKRDRIVKLTNSPHSALYGRIGVHSNTYAKAMEFDGSGNLKHTDYWASDDRRNNRPRCSARDGVWHVLLPDLPRFRPPRAPAEAMAFTAKSEPEGWLWRVVLRSDYHFDLPLSCFLHQYPKLTAPGTVTERQLIIYGFWLPGIQDRVDTCFGNERHYESVPVVYRTRLEIIRPSPQLVALMIRYRGTFLWGTGLTKRKIKAVPPGEPGKTADQKTDEARWLRPGDGFFPR